MAAGLLRPHLLLGKNGAQTKRASVLIGNHQPIGTAQTKGVSVRHGDHQAHGSHISLGKEVIFIDLYKGIHDDENNLWL